MLYWLKAIFICTCFGYVSPNNVKVSSNKKNMSQSDSNLLHKIMTSKIKVDAAQNDARVLDYIFNQTDKENTNDDIDFSVVNPKTMSKLYNSAKKKTLLANTKFNKTIKRQRPYAPYPEHEAYYEYTPFFVSKAMDLMKQSIYATRYRLQDTRALRKKYAHDHCYNIAILYGSLMQIRLKMDNVFATMNKLDYAVKFIHFLILYERTMQLTVDVNYMVEKIFDLYDHYSRSQMLESREQLDIMSTRTLPPATSPP